MDGDRSFKFPRKRVLVDFDGTLGAMSYPGVPSKPFELAAEVVRDLKARGYEIVLFSTRMWPGWDEIDGVSEAERARKEMLAFMYRWNIPYDIATHEKLPAMFIIDDRALNPGLHGWEEIRRIVLDSEKADAYGKVRTKHAQSED